MQNGLTTAPNIQIGTKQEVVTAPAFYKTVGASLASKYDPIRDFVVEEYRFGTAALPENVPLWIVDKLRLSRGCLKVLWLRRLTQSITFPYL